jgi:glutamate-1-semialdehyde 2,1-aminomutase
LFFTEKADIPMFNKLFHHLLNAGIYLPPSAYESWFLSNALTYQNIDRTIKAVDTFEK